jgi:serine/threonine protein kinase
MSEDTPVAIQDQLKLLSLGSGAILEDRVLILNEIGRGGMGVVYRCLDEDDTMCALKFVAGRKPEDSGQFRRRYIEEVKAMQFVRDMDNSCFPQIRHHDCIVRNGIQFPYYLMDFIDGVPLFSDIVQTGSLPVDDVIDIGVQILEGLTVLHQNTYHRDINPANVMRRWNGDVALIDLGLVRRICRTNQHLTRDMGTGPIGTPAFLPPEMACGEEIGAFTDTYLVGLTMYSLLTGDLEPIKGRTFIRKWVNAQQQRVTPPSSRIKRQRIEQFRQVEALDPFFLKATDLDPKKRFQTAQEALDALRPFQTQRRVPYIQPDLTDIVSDASWTLIPDETYASTVTNRYGGLITLAPDFEDKCKYHIGSLNARLSDHRYKPLKENEYVIGRGGQSDIIISSDEVSLEHVRIHKDDNQWYITPISDRITLLCGAPYVTGTSKWTALKPGETVSFTPGHWVQLGGVQRKIITPNQMRDCISDSREIDDAYSDIETKAMTYEDYQKKNKKPKDLF